jgi:type IV pilus assembly protein PilF
MRRFELISFGDANKLLLTALASAALLGGCVSTVTTETKVPDQAGKTDALFRAQIHTERASEYFRLGRYPVALEAAQQAVDSLPTHAPAYNMLGIVQMELKQDAKARESFEKAIRLAPDDSESLNNLGWFVCQRDDPKSAQQYFDRALTNPVYATPERAHYNKGVCAKRAGDLPLAESSLRAAMRVRPTFAPALYELSEIEFSRGKIREAETLLTRHNELVQAPTVEALFLGVRIARALGDKMAESSYVQQLRRRFPDATQTRAALDLR